MLKPLFTDRDRPLPRLDTPRLAHWAVLICALYGGAAHAADDALRPFVALGYTYDDNLFRVADNNPGYDHTRGDRSRQLQAGLDFSHTYGRQGVTLQAKVSKVSFDHFTQLDYNSKDLLASLAWQLGNHVNGNAGISYDQVLAPYTDIVTRERNLRVQKHAFVDGGWTFHPSWRVRASVTHDRYTYDLVSQRYNDRNDDALELGLDYLAATGSLVGVQADKIKRRYDQLRTVGLQAVDAGDDQKDVKLRVLWRATPVSSLQFLGGWAKRTHAYFSERDSSGVNAKLSGNTLLGGSVSLNGAVWRQYDGVESSLASYSLNTGASLGAKWAVTSQLTASADTRVIRRAFDGLLVAASALDVRDTSHTSSLGLDYSPSRRVLLNASLYRESRRGLATQLFGNGDYHAQGVSVNVNLQY
jgi:exopolysaccharide biosynthesis operon protein EpsL